MNVLPPRRRGCACRKCGARQMRARHPDEYSIRPRCKRCNGLGTLRLDIWYDARSAKRRPACDCDGYHFPHREGSPYCFHNPELDYDDRYDSGYISDPVRPKSA